MVQDQVEGAAQTVVGKVQDAVGAHYRRHVDASGRQGAPGARLAAANYGETIDNVRSAVVSAADQRRAGRGRYRLRARRAVESGSLTTR